MSVKMKPAPYRLATPHWEDSLGLYDKDGDLRPASKWPTDRGYNPYDSACAPSDAAYASHKRALNAYEFWFGRREVNYYTRIMVSQAG